MKHTWLNSQVLLISFLFTSYLMLGFTDEVAWTNRFLRWWSVSIERYLLFTKFIMETVFFTCVCRPEPATISQDHVWQGRKQRWRKKFPEKVNSWLSAFIYSDFVCHLESIHVPLVARVPRVSHHWHKSWVSASPGIIMVGNVWFLRTRFQMTNKFS